MALTLEPNTPQVGVIGQPLCFDGSAVLSIPQVDLQAVNLPSSGTNWTYSGLRFKKVSGTNNNYNDCLVDFDPDIFGARPFHFRATNDLFQTPGGDEHNYSTFFGVLDDQDREYGYEIFKYCNSTNCPQQWDWYIHVYWNGVKVYTRGVNWNENFFVESDGINLRFKHEQAGVFINDFAGALPITTNWRFRISVAYPNNSLGYVQVFKGTYQGSLPLTWSAPLGGLLEGTATRQCFTAAHSGLYQVCIDSEFDEPLCVDVQIDELYFNPLEFGCGGCVFTGETVHFESNGGLDGTLTAELVADSFVNVGTVIDALTWKAPDYAVSGVLLTYTLGEDSVSCTINVVPEFEVLNIVGDTITGLLPGEGFQILTNYEPLGGSVTWENLSCNNLVTPTGYVSIPINFENGCFGQIDCYIRVRINEFPGTSCPNLEPGGNQAFFRDYRILVDPVYPTPEFGGPKWKKWAPQVPDFRVLSKTMEGGCSETHIRNRVPVQKWSINYDNLVYEDNNPCAPPPCCDDPLGHVNGIDPKVRTAKVLDDFWMLTGGEYKYFTLIEPRTGETWRKVRFDGRMERDHVNWRKIQSRTVKLVWNPCCATAPAGAVCPHSTAIRDIYPPTVPENVNVTPISYSTLKVTWEKSLDNVGIKYYEIQVIGPIRPARKFKVGSFPTYYDTGLFPDTEYTYKVRSYDFDGNFSQWSDVASGTTLPHDTTPPAIPENFRYISLEEGEFLMSSGDSLVSGSDFLTTDEGGGTGYGILVEWDASLDPDIAGYQLIVDGYFIDVGNVTSYEDFPLEYCSEHHYYVRSYDTSGNHSHWTQELVAFTNCGEVDIVESGFPITDAGDTVVESS